MPAVLSTLIEKDRWRSVASKLQSYKLYNKDANVDYLTLAMVGMQTSGKTRFINIIGGKVIGGAMKAKVGTRCPVLYEFSNSQEEEYRIGTDPLSFEKVEQTELWNRITDHMDRIGDRFVKEILYVKISTPDTLTMTVFDLPGLKPDESDPQFHEIAAIYQHIMSEYKNIQLLLMTAVSTNLDVEFFRADVKKLRQAFGSHQGAFLNSIVLVSRLDSIRGTVGLDKLIEVRDCLMEQKLTQNQNNLIFLTLKPHLLDGSVDDEKDMTDKRNYDVASQNEYYRTIRETENRTLPEFLGILRRKADGKSLDGFNFGVGYALDRLDNLIIDTLKSNFRGIMMDLANRGEGLLQKVNELSKARDLSKIQLYIRSYCRMLAGILCHVATTDTQFINRIRHAEKNSFPDQIREELPSLKFHDVFNTFRHTFDQEQKMFAHQCNNKDFRLLSSDVLLRMDQDHQLRKLCDDILCGGGAVYRLLKVWMFDLLNQEVVNYSTSDIMTMCGMQDRNLVRSVSTTDVLRKIIEDIVCNYSSQVEFVCDWAADLYIRQFEPVMEKVSPFLTQLDNYPRLKAYVDVQLHVAHQKYFVDLARKAKSAIENSQMTRSSSLKLDTIYSLIRLLGCVRIPCSLLQPNYSRTDILSSWKKMIPGQSHSHAILDQLESSRDNVPAVLELLMSANFTAEDFAMCDTMKTLQMSGRTDVEPLNEIINHTANCFAKVSIGLNAMDAVDLIEKHITISAHDLDKQLQKVMDDEIFKLFRDDNKLLKEKLREEDEERIQIINQLIAELKQWQSTTQALVDVGGNMAHNPIKCLNKIPNAIAKLEAELQVEETTEVIKDTSSDNNDDSNETNSISEEESFEDGSMSCRREAFLISQIESLKGQLYSKGSTIKNPEEEIRRLKSEILIQQQRIRDLECQLGSKARTSISNNPSETEPPPMGSSTRNLDDSDENVDETMNEGGQARTRSGYRVTGLFQRK